MSIFKSKMQMKDIHALNPFETPFSIEMQLVQQEFLP